MVPCNPKDTEEALFRHLFRARKLKARVVKFGDGILTVRGRAEEMQKVWHMLKDLHTPG